MDLFHELFWALIGLMPVFVYISISIYDLEKHTINMSLTHPVEIHQRVHR